MKVKDAMSKNVISVAPGDTISKALSEMKKAKIHQLVVIDHNSLAGMLELKNIITKDLDPASTKAEGFYKTSTSVDKEMDLEQAATVLLGSGMRALPVLEKGKIAGILSETDILRSGIFSTKNISLKDIMTPCVYVDKYEKASKIKNLMFDTNVSRIPVLDGDNVLGIVGTLDMIKVLEAKSGTAQKPGRPGEKATSEKQKTSDITAESIMSKALVMPGETKLSEVIPLLEKNEELVVKSGEIGIITPKDILGMFAKKQQKGVYVQITGMHDVPAEFASIMDSAIQDFVTKFTKISDKIEYLMVHVDKMHKQGPKQKYSVRVRVKAPFGMFVSHAWGWKSNDVIQEAFNKLEREFLKKYEQIKSHDKQKKSRGQTKSRL
jgi:CBS domain-containing protein/ribosome-associated translation inhibitor RaiA